MKFSYIFFAFLLLNSTLLAQKGGDYKVASIGFYNLENFFDTLDNPITNDADFLPTGRLLWDTPKYMSKVHNMANVVSQMGTELTPDGLAILGVAEIENRKVLEDMISDSLLKARNYQIVHFESPDRRGIDCAFIYQAKYFTLLGAKPYFVSLKRDNDTVQDFTRDILYMCGNFDGEKIHLMVGHWPSRLGGESASAWRRARAAGVCKHIADSLRIEDPNAKIIVMGDLNDDPNNKSVTEVLQSKGDIRDVGPGDMYNPMYDFFKNGNGTLAYRDSWDLFDQMMLSQAFVMKKTGGWQLYKALIFRKPWLLQTEGAFRGYPFRTFVGDIFINGYSDHLPVYLFMLKKK
ncbi:MAG: endonuclease/exonuclease/phosphatase family protein [Bacteroidota bacterium]